MEALVYIAHSSNAFLLWYVCVQACYIHRHQNDIFWDYRILYEVDKICHIFEIRVLQFGYRLEQTVYK